MTTSHNFTGCWADVQDAINAGIDRIILFGPPGTGKTYAGLTLGDTTGGAYRLVCTDEMTSADVTGHYKPAGDRWNWVDGNVISAWEGNGVVGGRVVADEIDKASGDVFGLLLAMFDTPESANWKHPETGRVVRPRPGFSVVMTTNLEHMEEIPTALKDRFPIAIRINEPHPGALAVLPSDLREAARKSADADRDRRFSIRTFQAFDKLRKSMEQERAAKLVFGRHANSILDALRIEALA
jgi:MoxR-like ATPase